MGGGGGGEEGYAMGVGGGGDYASTSRWSGNGWVFIPTVLNEKLICLCAPIKGKMLFGLHGVG